MPEHRIRLRGGWQCQYREGDDPDGPEVLRRVDLPLASTAGLPARFLLCRQFGRPPCDPLVERVTLEIGNLPGLRSVRLNGRPIDPDPSTRPAWSFRLDGPILPRNGLIIEVELTDAPPAEGDSWGEVALVIRPLDGAP
jgi:hypothetical protein